MDIKVLGPGCDKSNKTEKLVKETVSESNVEAKIEKVTDPRNITDYGVLGTPVVVVNGEVKSFGKIPSKEEIRGWIENNPLKQRK